MIHADKELLLKLWDVCMENLMEFGQNAYPDGHERAEDKIYHHALISDDTMDDVKSSVLGICDLIDVVRGDRDFAEYLLEAPDQWIGLEDPRTMVGWALEKLGRKHQSEQWNEYEEHRWDDDPPPPPLIVTNEEGT